MANGNACCGVRPFGAGGGPLGGYQGSGGGGGVSGGGSSTGIVERVANAIDDAVHNEGQGSDGRGGSAGASGGYVGSGGQVIDFPMVNPFKPIIRTRSPFPGINADGRFPNKQLQTVAAGIPSVRDVTNFNYSVKTFNTRGTEDTKLPGDTDLENFGGLGGFGFNFEQQGVSLPGSGSNLQAILNAITTGLATVPAIISARKKQPYYDPNAGQYPQSGAYGQPGYGQAGANVGSQVGGAVGNVGDTLGNIVAQHPYLVLAGGAALVLLFMSPPRRR